MLSTFPRAEKNSAILVTVTCKIPLIYPLREARGVPNPLKRLEGVQYPLKSNEGIEADPLGHLERVKTRTLSTRSRGANAYPRTLLYHHLPPSQGSLSVALHLQQASLGDKSVIVRERRVQELSRNANVRYVRKKVA